MTTATLTAASGTWVAPPGILPGSTVQIYGDGAGGDQGFNAPTAHGGNGGGGGGFTQATMNFTGGTGYPYTVGQGGASGNSGTGSSINSSTAGGGNTNGTGGTGTTYNGGAGGSGANGSGTSGGGGGGGAGGPNGVGGTGTTPSGSTGGPGGSGNGGNAGNGGTGGTRATNNASPGTNYGGGGGGGGGEAGSEPGGAGAPGVIVITYTTAGTDLLSYTGGTTYRSKERKRRQRAFAQIPPVVTSGSFALAPVGFSGDAAEYVKFPANPLPQKYELLLNGTWTDITAYVYQRSPVTITPGRPDETQSWTPMQATLTLNNRDGRFSPKNSGGAYYPFIGRNVQLRISIVYVASASGASTYNGYRFWGEVSEWPPQWDPSQTDIYVDVVASGVLRRLQQSKTTFGAGLDYYYTSLNSSYGLIAYWPCDDATGAGSFASGLAGGSAMTWTGTPDLAVGTEFTGVGALPALNGSVWSGSGSGFSSGSFIQTVPGTYSWPCPNGITAIKTGTTGAGGGGSGAGNGPSSGGTGGGGGEYSEEDTLAVSFPNSYTYVVGTGGTGGSDTGGDGGNGGDSYFTGDSVTCRGHGGTGGGTGGGGGGGGTGSSNSIHYNGGNGFYFGDPGGGGGSSGGTASAGFTPNSQSGGTAVTGGGPGGAGGDNGVEGGQSATPGNLPVSGPGGGGGGGGEFNTVGGAGYGGQVAITISGSATAPANCLRFLLDIPAGGGVNGAVLAQLTTVGTVATVNVVYGTGGTLKLVGYNSTPAQIFTSTAAGSYNGVPVIVSVELTPSGSNVDWALKTIPPGLSESATTLGSGSVAGTVNDITGFTANYGGTDSGQTIMGGVALLYGIPSLPDVAVAAYGYVGETAGARFERLCTAAGFAYEFVGNTADTPQMGPQVTDTLVNLLQGIEDFDRGQLYETRDQFGIGYITRVALQNQSAAATLDYSLAVLAQPLAPVVDDQLSRNDVTITRAGGSSAEVALTSGTMSNQDPPNGIGEYAYSKTVSAYADSQLANCAQWILDIGTVDEYRYPVVVIDLSRAEAAGLFATVAGLYIGSYFQITNPPSFVDSATVKQLVLGYTETFGPFGIWKIAINAVPESPYEGNGLPTW